jgi:hypothetical protein
MNALYTSLLAGELSDEEFIEKRNQIDEKNQSHYRWEHLYKWKDSLQAELNSPHRSRTSSEIEKRLETVDRHMAEELRAFPQHARYEKAFIPEFVSTAFMFDVMTQVLEKNPQCGFFRNEVKRLSIMLPQ